jgi:hypothetical protein
VSWWNVLAAPIAALLALTFGRRVWFWSLFAILFGFWSMIILLLPYKDPRIPKFPNWLLASWSNWQIARIMRPIRDPSDLL